MNPDEAEIRDLVARYADAVNRRDEAAWGATWAKDGEWDLSGRPASGRDAVVALWSQLMGGIPWVNQIVYFGLVDVDGAAATGRWYLAEFMKLPDGTGRQMIGVYRDQYVKEDGAWKFAKRRMDPVYSGPPDLSGDAMPFPAEG